MDAWQRQLNFWDKNWKGESYNGRNLKDELAAHNADEAADSRNHEGYTIWGIALHVHRFKELFLSALEDRPAVWPEGDGNFPAVPERLNQARWAVAQTMMAETHDALLSRVRLLDEAFLETTYAPWGVSWGDALTWASSHEVYHTAQIRNMRQAA